MKIDKRNSASLEELKNDLNELFEKLPEIEIDWWATMDAATISLPKGTNININFSRYGQGAYRADFNMKDRGKANPMEIFMGAAKAIGEFMKRKKPREMAFIPFDFRREKIYKRILSKYLDVSKWDMEEEEAPFVKTTMYVIKRK